MEITGKTNSRSLILIHIINLVVKEILDELVEKICYGKNRFIK
jgi:hypothetical protein